jgi:hypothetical protein
MQNRDKRVYDIRVYDLRVHFQGRCHSESLRAFNRGPVDLSVLRSSSVPAFAGQDNKLKLQPLSNNIRSSRWPETRIAEASSADLHHDHVFRLSPKCREDAHPYRRRHTQASRTSEHGPLYLLSRNHGFRGLTSILFVLGQITREK